MPEYRALLNAVLSGFCGDERIDICSRVMGYEAPLHQNGKPEEGEGEEGESEDREVMPRTASGAS